LSGRALAFTAYLRTPEAGDYVPLARDVDLRTVVSRDGIAAIAPCE
jgi:hypothetical protein